MEEDKYWLLMSRYLSNEITLEETDELLRWIEEDPERTVLLQQLQTSFEKTTSYAGGDYAFDANIAWKKVSSKLVDEKTEPLKKTKMSYLGFLKFAAVFLILLNFGWFGYRYYDNRLAIEIVNQDLEVKEVLLPDGSKVWLNKGSSLSYHKGINNLNERTISMEGEAFFEVERNPAKPFVIKVNGTETKVLGTSFNVKSSGEKVLVSVFTGKVSFKEANSTNQLMLLPGEEGVFTKSIGLLKTSFDDKNFMFWKDRNLDFSNESLGEILAVVAKVYEVEFKLSDPDLKKKRITTSFHKQSLSEIKNILEVILDKKIEQAGNVYVVK